MSEPFSDYREMSVAPVSVWRMSESERTRAAIQQYLDSLIKRDWTSFAAVLTEDVEYELPQTNERISGREKFVRFNAEYPGDWTLEVTRLLADGDTAAATFNLRLDEQDLVGIAFFQLTDGVIARVTDFWPEPYEPPAGREDLVERVPARTDRLSLG